jgi:MFS family permease
VTRESSASSDRAVIAAVGLAVMLLPLNTTMLAVALPDIASDTGGGVAASSWLVTGYVVALLVLGPFAGRLGDRVGRRRVVLAGLAWFAAASTLAAAAPSLPLLVVGRVMQAAAGSLVLPNGMAILRTTLPAGRRAAGFGAVAAVFGVAAAAGPALGGLVVDVFGWRAIFLVNLPVVAAATVMVLWVIRADDPTDAADRETRSHGAVRRVLKPAFLTPTAATGLSTLAMYSTLLGVPVVLTHHGGWSTADIGLALALMSAVMVALAPFAGRLADRRGHRAPALAGLSMLAVAMAWLATMGTDPSAGGVLVALSAVGAGLGLTLAPLQAAAIEAVCAADAGVASGLYSTGRYTGNLIAAVLLAAVLGDGGTGASTLFAIGAGSALFAAVLGTMLDHHAPQRPPVALQRA